MTMFFKTLLCFVFIGVGGLLGFGCRKEVQPTATDSADSVAFKINVVAATNSDSGEQFICLGTYDKGGKVAKFRIELSLPQPKGNSPFAFGKGAFGRDPGSDDSVLLNELANVMRAKKSSVSSERVDTLSFTTAVLGRNLTRGRGKDSLAGSFTSVPRGDWIAVKVFVADGEGEFFLNLNPKTGDGEFSLKDPDYGDVVLRELSKVL